MAAYSAYNWAPYEAEADERTFYAPPPPDADYDDYDAYAYDASGNYEPAPDPYVSDDDPPDSYDPYTPAEDYDPYTPPPSVEPVTDPYQTDYVPDEAYVATLPAAPTQPINVQAPEPEYINVQPPPGATARPITRSEPPPPLIDDPLTAAYADPNRPQAQDRLAAQHEAQAQAIATGTQELPRTVGSSLGELADWTRRNEANRPGSPGYFQREQARRQELLGSQTLQHQMESQLDLYQPDPGPSYTERVIGDPLIAQMDQYAYDPAPVLDDPLNRGLTDAVVGARPEHGGLVETATTPPTDGGVPLLSGLGNLVGPPVGQWVRDRQAELTDFAARDPLAERDIRAQQDNDLSGFDPARIDRLQPTYNTPQVQRDALQGVSGYDPARTDILPPGATANSELQMMLSGAADLPMIEGTGAGAWLEDRAGQAGELATFLDANAGRAPELLSAVQYGNVEMAAQQAYDLQEFGDPYRTYDANALNALRGLGQLLPGMTGLPGIDGFNGWLQNNPLLVKQGMEQGYGDFAPGPRAVWELFQAEHGTIERGLFDVGTDPTIALPGVAGGLKAGSGAARAAGKGAGLLPKLVGKLETPLDAAAWLTGASDTAFSAGLNKVTEGDWWRRGPFALTEDARRQMQAEQARDIAGSVVGDMRSQMDATGGLPPGTGFTPPDGGWDSPRGPRVGDLRIIDTPEGESIVTRAENSEVIAGPMPRAEAEAHLANITRPVAAPRRTSPTGGPDTPGTPRSRPDGEPRAVDVDEDELLAQEDEWVPTERDFTAADFESYPGEFSEGHAGAPSTSVAAHDAAQISGPIRAPEFGNREAWQVSDRFLVVEQRIDRYTMTKPEWDVYERTTTGNRKWKHVATTATHGEGITHAQDIIRRELPGAPRRTSPTGGPDTPAQAAQAVPVSGTTPGAVVPQWMQDDLANAAQHDPTTPAGYERLLTSTGGFTIQGGRQSRSADSADAARALAAMSEQGMLTLPPQTASGHPLTARVIGATVDRELTFTVGDQVSVATRLEGSGAGQYVVRANGRLVGTHADLPNAIAQADQIANGLLRTTAPPAPRRTSPTGGPDTPSQAAATTVPLRPPAAAPAPSRLNAQGEAISPEGWTPSAIRPNPRDHTRGAPNVPRLRGNPALPREDSWVIDTGSGVRPMTVEDAQRGFGIFASPKMTTQKFDSPDGVQWRTAMFDQGLIDYVPAPRASYQSFVGIIAPLVRKEPDAWDAIAQRGDFPETTIDHARRIANGESIDDIMADVANREAAASYIQRSAARLGRTIELNADLISDLADESTARGDVPANFRLLDPHQIEIDPVNFQPRTEAGNLGGLNDASIRSMRENFDAGRLDPIVVWKRPADGKHVLLSGHHRLELMRQRNEQIPARIFEGSFEDAQDVAYRSNSVTPEKPTAIGRKLLREIEKGAGIEDAMSVHNISSRTRAQQYIDATHLPGNLQELVDNGQLDLPRGARMGRAVREGVVEKAWVQQFYEGRVLVLDYSLRQIDSFLKIVAEKKRASEMSQGDLFSMAGIEVGTNDAGNQIDALIRSLEDADKARLDLNRISRRYASSDTPSDQTLVAAARAKVGEIEAEIVQLRQDLGISGRPPRPSRQALGIAADPTRGVSDFVARSRQPGFVQQTATAHLDEIDQRQPGFWSLTTGLMLDEDQETLLRTVITKGVDRVRHRTVGEVLLEYQADMTLLRRLHVRVNAGGLLAPGDHARLTRLESKFRLIDPPRTDTEADAAVLAAIGRDIDINIGLRDEAGNIVSTKSKAGQVIDSVLAWFRKMTLYDTFGGPAYAMLNLVGNTITAGIARPSAMIQYWMSVPKAVRKSFGSAATSWTDDMFTATGLGKTDFLSAAGRDQIKHSKDLFTTPGGRQLGKISGMQAMRDLAVGIDAAWREAAYRNLAEPALRGMHREMQRHALEALIAWVNRGKSLGITTDQLREALATLPRNGQYKGEDIQTAILELIPEGGAIPLDLMTFTDRLGRDWKAALRAMDKAAKAQTNRLAFSGAMTKADSILGRFVLFHYWNSRASRLYATEALRKPYLLGAYFDFMDWAQEEAEQQNAPGYLKAILGKYNTPAGATLFFNPVAFFGTMFINQETEIGDAGTQRVTDLGRLQIEGWNPTGGRLGLVDATVNGLLNLMPNPILDAAAYVTGAKGTDGRLPFDPLASWTRAFTDLTNMASSNGVDLPWVVRDASGAPARFPDFSITGQMVNWAAQALSDDRGNLTQAVGPRNFDATAEAEFNAHLVTAARTLNPEATDQELADLVIAARLDPSSDIYKLGLDGINDARWELGLGVDWPAWIRVPANAAGRVLIDRAVTQVATERNALTGIPTGDLTEGQQAIKSAIYSGSPESEAIDAAVDGYWQIGTPPKGQQPATAEEIGRLIAGAYQAIKRGEVTNGFIVDGVTYRPDQVNAMDQETRDQLAQDWLSGVEYAGAGGWDLHDAYYQARDAYLTEHPEIEAAVAIRALANDYPGGAELWIRDTRQINAAYDQFVTALEQKFPAGDPEIIRIATGASAAKAINAEPGSMYTVYPDTTGQYEAAGTDGLSLDAYAIQQREAEAAERAAEDAEHAGPSEFEQDAWNDLQKVEVVMRRLDELDAHFGIPVGTSREIYRGNLLNTTEEKLPYAVYRAIDAEYDARGASYWPQQDGGGEQYLRWANSQPQGADVSFDAWSEWSLEQYKARQDAIDEQTGEDFDPAGLVWRSSPPPASETADPNFVGSLPRSRATMPAPTPTPETAAPPPAPHPAQTAELAPTLTVGRTVSPISSVGAANARTAPGLDAPIFVAVQNGAPLTIVGEQGFNGETWAHVRFPDGNTAWIRSDLLGYTD